MQALKRFQLTNAEIFGEAVGIGKILSMRKDEALFENCFIVAEEARDPSLIKWENLGVSSFSRWIRFLASQLVVVGLIVATMYASTSQNSVRLNLQRYEFVGCKDPEITQAKVDAAIVKEGW